MTLKSIINQRLNNSSIPRDTKKILCEVMDEILAEHRYNRNQYEGFMYLDLYDNEQSMETWRLGGKPAITPKNICQYINDPYRREYF